MSFFLILNLNFLFSEIKFYQIRKFLFNLLRKLDLNFFIKKNGFHFILEFRVFNINKINLKNL